MAGIGASSAGMDPLYDPPDRKRPRPFRLAFLLGMTVLLFFMIWNHYDQIATVLHTAHKTGLG